MSGPIGDRVDRLHEPFPDAYKVLTQKTFFDEIVQRLEQQRPTLVRQLTLFPTAVVRPLQVFRDEIL